ncbi:hypothetical protein KIL84_004286 [Mauremys mutica]|uniref:Uncharacterized protein n=1 Tax=Mauremys mutica TaxID=74926 RepID=A0A9D3XLH2_9SAUR|nr:hypothetical protein KIL84_004286 [Mauremys mutica]
MTEEIIYADINVLEDASPACQPSSLKHHDLWGFARRHGFVLWIALAGDVILATAVIALGVQVFQGRSLQTDTGAISSVPESSGVAQRHSPGRECNRSLDDLVSRLKQSLCHSAQSPSAACVYKLRCRPDVREAVSLVAHCEPLSAPYLLRRVFLACIRIRAGTQNVPRATGSMGEGIGVWGSSSLGSLCRLPSLCPLTDTKPACLAMPKRLGYFRDGNEHLSSPKKPIIGWRADANSFLFRERRKERLNVKRKQPASTLFRVSMTQTPASSIFHTRQRIYYTLHPYCSSHIPFLAAHGLNPPPLSTAGPLLPPTATAHSPPLLLPPTHPIAGPFPSHTPVPVTAGFLSHPTASSLSSHCCCFLPSPASLPPMADPFPVLTTAHPLADDSFPHPPLHPSSPLSLPLLIHPPPASAGAWRGGDQVTSTLHGTRGHALGSSFSCYTRSRDSVPIIHTRIQWVPTTSWALLRGGTCQVHALPSPTPSLPAPLQPASLHRDPSLRAESAP